MQHNLPVKDIKSHKIGPVEDALKYAVPCRCKLWTRPAHRAKPAPALDILPQKDLPYLSSLAFFSSSLSRVLISEHSQYFFSRNCFFHKRTQSSQPFYWFILISMRLKLLDLKFAWCVPTLPDAPSFCRQREIQKSSHSWPLLQARSAPSQKALENPNPPFSSNITNLESLNKHSLLEKKKISFLVAVSRRRLFQLNDLQIKSMKTRMHLWTSFPSSLNVLIIFSHSIPVIFATRAITFPVHFLNVGGGAVQWSQSICFWFS